ncbi:MAG: PD-(D/E)XK motif protein [Gemmatimonadota bacterium]|uniref:PD-(D/E)XK motif protein n=1 Tax=Candidatus Palauibacter scopulicola TaxID=3056741 RepID=UPI0023A03996|nr:PD-(D/E)XK motif protein [Candidatus Palauibacter scopulicola]MDE2663825.1 PD-(D/E)XK motif protein [Candidatus Palauibacter scopulicola]
MRVCGRELARIARGAGCADAALATIEDFQTLLTRSSAPAVTTGMAAGLLAELLVLNRLLDRSPSAWNAWRGPAGDRHDFRAGDTSLEVKASLRSGAPTITIHGLHQLEVPSGGTLHLIRVILEPVSDGVLRVSDVVESASSKADKPSRLAELLAASGFTNANAQEWDRYAFRHESEKIYEIRTGFPRLTPTVLKDASAIRGVQDVSYKIDLSAAERFMCNAAVFHELELKLCS